MNVLSLFDGISCGQVAFDKLRIKFNGIENKYYASEIEPNAIKIAMKNYPNTIQLGDVRNLKTEDFKNINIIIGGSPCQNFSFAGSMKGAVTKDKIEVTTLEQYLELKENGFEFDGCSYLVWEYVRLLKEIKPKYFLLENVKMSKKWEKVITDALGVEPIFINSDLVSAQTRKRLYWTNIPNITLPKDKGLLLKDVVQPEHEKKLYNCTNRIFAKREGTLAYKKAWGSVKTLNQKSKALTTAQNISNSGATNIKYNENKYYIPTPIKCERLQTLPDNYTEGISNTQRYKCIGNGWTVDIISHIFSFIPEIEDYKE